MMLHTFHFLLAYEEAACLRTYALRLRELPVAFVLLRMLCSARRM